MVHRHLTLLAISKILKHGIICIFFFCSIYTVQARSFQNLTLTYSFDTNDNIARSTFRIDSTTGDITLQTQLSYQSSPHQYNFNVTVKEAYSNFVTTTTVRVKHNTLFSMIQSYIPLAGRVCCNSSYKHCLCLFVQTAFISPQMSMETSIC